MRQTKHLFLIFLFYALQSCVTDYIDSPDSTNTDEVTSFRQFFERNAPALVPVSFGESAGDITTSSTRRSLPTRVSTFNIIPDWSSCRREEHESFTLLEIPLKGEIYNRATLVTQHQSSESPGGFTLETRVLSGYSFLLAWDKENGEAPSCVVATLITENDSDGEIHFLGNRDISGIIVFSTISGRHLRSYHIKNGKWRPIHITPDREEGDGKEFAQFTLEYTSSGKTRGYTTREGSGGGYGFGTGGSYVRCALCNTLYDFLKGDCPKGCGDDSWFVTCPICDTKYDIARGDCPNKCTDYRPQCELCGTQLDPNTGKCPNGCGEVIDGGYEDWGGGGGSDRNPNKDENKETNNNKSWGIITINSSHLVVEAPNTYTITVNISNCTRDITAIDYYMRRAGRGDIWIAVYDGVTNGYTCTYTRKAFAPGYWQIKAVVHSGKETVDSGIISVEEQFPSIERFKNNIKLRDYLSTTLWNKCVTYASDNKSRHAVREYGCFIYMSSNGVYHAGDPIEGPEVILNADGATGYVQFEYSDVPYDPRADDYQLLVGTMHTHYPLTWAAAGAKRIFGASAFDEANALPGIGYDYAFDLKTGHKVDASKAFFTYGRDRRETTE